MELDTTSRFRKQLGRLITTGSVIAAVSLGLVVIYQTNYYPRTDDAEVFANFIGIAPQVEGRLVRLCVSDNQFVKKGELLFEIDERPYEYALERALSEQETLEGQITDEARRITALVSAVSVSQANISSSEADVTRWAAGSRSGPGGHCKRRAGRTASTRGVGLRKQQSESHSATAGQAVRYG